MRKGIRMLSAAFTMLVLVFCQGYAERPLNLFADERMDALRNLPVGSVCDLAEVFPEQWDSVDIVNAPLKVTYFHDTEWEEFHRGLSEMFRLSDGISGMIFRRNDEIVKFIVYESGEEGAPLFKSYDKTVELDICQYAREEAVFAAVRKGENGEILFLPLSASGKDVDSGIATYYTTDEDKYYHDDIACDEGAKVPVSEEAALLFGKRACPVCVKGLKPVYTGDAVFEWTFEGEPWALNDFDMELRQRVRAAVPEAFREESRETRASFDKLYIDEQTGEQLCPFPEDHAGRYLNRAGGMTFLLADPTPETIAAFKAQFGGGVWIVPAKYSMAELETIRSETIAAVEAALAARPGLDARWVAHSVYEAENVVRIEFYGADSRAFIDGFDFHVAVRCSVTDSLPMTD